MDDFSGTKPGRKKSAGAAPAIIPPPFRLENGSGGHQQSAITAGGFGCEAAKDSANRARFCHQPFEDLLLQAKQVSDVAERTKLYEEAQVIFKEEAPWATIAHSIVFKPVRKEVTGFKIDPFGGHIFYGVDIEG